MGYYLSQHGSKDLDRRLYKTIKYCVILCFAQNIPLALECKETKVYSGQSNKLLEVDNKWLRI